MKYKILGNRVKLLNSCEVKKANFSRELDKIRNLHPTCRLWKRSDRNIIREWAAHVLAYNLGIRRDKTEDTDLEYEPKWWMSLFYFIVGGIALIIIK